MDNNQINQDPLIVEMLTEDLNKIIEKFKQEVDT